jgi:hypothetical protein
MLPTWTMTTRLARALPVLPGTSIVPAGGGGVRDYLVVVVVVVVYVKLEIEHNKKTSTVGLARKTVNVQRNSLASYAAGGGGQSVGRENADFAPV